MTRFKRYTHTNLDIHLYIGIKIKRKEIYNKFNEFVLALQKKVVFLSNGMQKWKTLKLKLSR